MKQRNSKGTSFSPPEEESLKYDDDYDEEEGSGQRKSKRIKRNTWTFEEEAIIVREYKNNPGNYLGAAMNHLPGRSRDAIKSRWNLHLKKHHSSDTI